MLLWSMQINHEAVQARKENRRQEYDLLRV